MEATFDVMHLNDDLPDLGPVGVVNAVEDVEFTLLGVELEQVYALNVVIPDEVGNPLQRADDLLAEIPAFDQFVRVLGHQRALMFEERPERKFLLVEVCVAARTGRPVR